MYEMFMNELIVKYKVAACHFIYIYIYIYIYTVTRDGHDFDFKSSYI